MNLCPLLFTACVLLFLVISPTAYASKPNAIVLLGEGDSYKPPSSIVNVAEEVVSVKNAVPEPEPRLSFADIKLHTSERVKEKKRKFEGRKALSLTPTIQTKNPPLGIGESFQNHVQNAVRAIKGVASKRRVKLSVANLKKSAKLITKLRTKKSRREVALGTGNGSGNNNNNVVTKVRMDSVNTANVQQEKRDTKVNLKTNVRTKTGEAAKETTDLKANLRSAVSSAEFDNDGDGDGDRINANVRKSGGVDGNGVASVVDERLRLVARPLKTSVRTEADETLMHREMHYEFTSVYPPTCPCVLGTGLAPTECWYYTDDSRTSCQSRQCHKSWVCVAGGENTGTTCRRKKTFTKTVRNEDGLTCTTKDHIAYSYEPYS